ncbi:MAG: 4Fe-4S cluster-binding domain-containing protein [candidate division KSB1 bacterium]|nr:4Fe-4S cluster-binding domain-containing protein [candidate division KSB1 bacterium]
MTHYLQKMNYRFPSYLTLFESGELAERVQQAKEHLHNCRLCPRHCGVNRSAGQLGFCQVDDQILLYKPKIHFGEEPPVSGSRGSGILFFSGCTMACVYCQNYPMSHWRQGDRVSPRMLARIMLFLQQNQVHNLNLVTATQFLPRVLEALMLAIPQGFHLPIVYNTNAYESIETLRLLDGIVDIYLPDFKYVERRWAKQYSATPNYPEICQRAIKEMYRQVGDLVVDDEGIARHGVLIRHLILPNGLASTAKVLEILTTKISPRITFSLMSQYLPLWEARRYPDLARRITPEEYDEALRALAAYHIDRGWIQEYEEK